MDETLPRALRLPRRSEFKRAYEQGRRAHGRLVVIYVMPHGERPVEAAWRLGITASRKVGGSVVRNRLRRCAREFFRRNKPLLTGGYDYVVNYKSAAAAADFAALDADLRSTLRRLGLASPSPEPPAPAITPPEHGAARNEV